MTVTSLKDVDSFIYSKVVLPLKELDVDSMNMGSPITEGRHSLDFFVSREEVTHVHYDHNYLRDEARNSAKHIINGTFGGMTAILADYDPKNHKVTVYSPAFVNIPKGKLIMNRLLSAFNNYAPFRGIEILDTTRDAYMGGRYPVGEMSNDDRDYDEDDDGEEDY